MLNVGRGYVVVAREIGLRKQMLAPDFKSKDGSWDTPCFLLHKMKGYGIILVSLFSLTNDLSRSTHVLMFPQENGWCFNPYSLLSIVPNCSDEKEPRNILRRQCNKARI